MVNWGTASAHWYLVGPGAGVCDGDLSRRSHRRHPECSLWSETIVCVSKTLLILGKLSAWVLVHVLGLALRKESRTQRLLLANSEKGGLGP